MPATPVDDVLCDPSRSENYHRIGRWRKTVSQASPTQDAMSAYAASTVTQQSSPVFVQNVYTESEYCTFRVPNLCLTHPSLTIYVYTVLRLVLSLAVSASRPCPLNGRRRRSRQHFVQRTPHYLMSLCYCDLVARPWNRSIPCGSTKPPGTPRIHSHIGTLRTINSLTLSRFDYAPRPKPLATHDEEIYLYRFTRKGRRRCFCS